MLSVIIPVFRVENYIERCIKSIVQQSYKDMEIILVDDGSDDGCPAILDFWKEKDSRIKVIHKENGGLSDARNAGIKEATGEFITFVDSDDYIHPRMYEIIMGIFNEDINVVMCPYTLVDENDNDKQIDISNNRRILYHHELMERMFSDEYGQFVVAWNKVYRRSMWENIRFPKGKIHEDEFTTYKFLVNEKCIGYACDGMYFYRTRNGSIMSDFNADACLHNVQALKEKMEYFKCSDFKAQSLCASKSLETMIYYYDRAITNNAKDTALEIRKIFLEKWNDISRNKSINISKERRLYFNSFSKSMDYMKKVMPFYWKWVGLSGRILRKGKSIKRGLTGRIGVLSKENPKVVSIEDTLRYIIENKVSVSRFGDGEFKWMAEIPNVTFQENSPEMARRLREISVSDVNNHIVCVTDVFGSLSKYNKDAKHFWYDFMGEYRKCWISYLKKGKTYYNTNITRPYMDYKDKSSCGKRFELLKKVWEGRDIVIVEGEKSRLGIGNDLFDGAKSVKRILAPVKNAYLKYDDILREAMKQSKDKLFILALGPSATILAYDLAINGYQAMDCGHMDIEYEWFLQGATKKVSIKNKYVNEVDAGRGVGELTDDFYQSQIIARIRH